MFMESETENAGAENPGAKELTAAILLLAKKLTAFNSPEDEERMESIIDEYTEFKSRL
jgi:hypothetical protein